MGSINNGMVRTNPPHFPPAAYPPMCPWPKFMEWAQHFTSFDDPDTEAAYQRHRSVYGLWAVGLAGCGWTSGVSHSWLALMEGIPPPPPVPADPTPTCRFPFSSGGPESEMPALGIEFLQSHDMDEPSTTCWGTVT